MRIARLLFVLPAVVTVVAAFITLLATALLGEVHMRGAYQLRQENESFTAACTALLAAMFAVRPVYLQLQAQSLQAALELLRGARAGEFIRTRAQALRERADAL